MFRRILKIGLPPGQSAFLWGARQTGKSSFLKEHFKGAIYYNLLDTFEAARLIKSPYLLREELLSMLPVKQACPIIIDEVQKIPELLNEVHWLIENNKFQFILF